MHFSVFRLLLFPSGNPESMKCAQDTSFDLAILGSGCSFSWIPEHAAVRGKVANWMRSRFILTLPTMFPTPTDYHEDSLILEGGGNWDKTGYCCNGSPCDLCETSLGFTLLDSMVDLWVAKSPMQPSADRLFLLSDESQIPSGQTAESRVLFLVQGRN